jgi:NTE family protein
MSQTATPTLVPARAAPGPAEKKNLDIVLEGGGVKGLGAAGAAIRLLEEGHVMARVAGTSVGAIVGAFLAAQADATVLKKKLDSLELDRVLDPGTPGLAHIGRAIGLITESGACQGTYIRRWLREELADLGVETFGDLRRHDAGDDPDLDPAQRYGLVVMATDITNGRLLRLPWDYHLFGLDPDFMPVADAVYMSMAIPLVFRPWTLDGEHGRTATVVDGGVLSNFAVEIFDRRDGRTPRWPTIGVRLLPDLPAGLGSLWPITGLPTPPPIRLIEQVLATMLVGRDQTHLDQPEVRARTIEIDTRDVGILDFNIDAAERQRAVDQGWRTADAFLRNGSRAGAVLVAG